ncbi:MAG: 50S ribosomal protein L15 [Mariprofundales bacterium]
MKLNELQPTKGSRQVHKRLGCGIGSGHGKTSGRGHKGQKSRSGVTIRRGFEGGQMPLARRVPKRGFVSHANPVQIVNVGQLALFDAEAHIDIAALYAAGLIRNTRYQVKLLAQGDVKNKFDVHLPLASKSAREKIEAAGGTITLE